MRTKEVVKVENQMDEAPSSGRSKRAPSIASSRKTNTLKLRSQKTVLAPGSSSALIARMDTEQKSRQGDSVRGSERKENLNIQVKESVHSGIRDLVRKG